MSSRCQAVAAHTPVVGVFVACPTEGSQAYYHIAGLDTRIVDYIRTFHTATQGRIDDDGTNQIAHIGRFTAGEPYADTKLTHFLQKFFRPFNNSRYYLAGNPVFIPSYGRRKKHILGSPHTNHIIGIHHNGILRNAFPNREIAGGFPIHISQSRFGTCPIGMHNATLRRIIAQIVGNNLTKSMGKNTLIDVGYGFVHLFLRSRNTA